MGSDARAPSVYSMGSATLRIDRKTMHGAIRRSLVARLRSVIPQEEQGIVLLQGGKPFTLYATDMDGLFKQESYFQYLFGVLEEENYFGAIDVRTGRALLFMPRLPPSYAVWYGSIHTPQDILERYAVDAVHYSEDMADQLAQLAPPTLHVLHGVNSDSGATVEGPTFEKSAQFKIESKHLFPVLAEARVHKTREEVKVMRYSNQVASAAHVEVMRRAKPGMYEYQLEAIFLGQCYGEGGCRNAAYVPICASGPNGAVLHYGHAGAPNDRQIQDGDMLLLDMGCQYYGYCSDITCSFPANGSFTPDQKAVYEAVLSAHQGVIKAMAPGVSWPELHLLAEKAILTGLKAAGFLAGSVEEMLEKRVGALFMPHGLGHFLGLDTHDVGGYLPGQPPRIEKPGLKHLRTARVLEPGMVITVEPGCYFGRYLLEPAMTDPETAEYFVKARIESMLDFGGVRLEDNVLVTDRGAETLTNVPRTVADIEAVMAGAPWPPKA